MSKPSYVVRLPWGSIVMCAVCDLRRADHKISIAPYNSARAVCIGCANNEAQRFIAERIEFKCVAIDRPLIDIAA